VHPSQDSGAGCGRQWETGEDLNLPRLEPACRLRHGAGGRDRSGRFDSRVPMLTHSGFPSMSHRFPRAPFAAFAVASGDGIGSRRSEVGAQKAKGRENLRALFLCTNDGSVGPAPGTTWPLQAPGAAAARTRMRVAPAVLRPAPARSAVRFDLRTAPAARPPISACSRCAPGGRIQLQKNRVRAPGMMSQVRQNFRQIAPEDIPGAARCASGRFGHVPRGARRLPGRVLDVPKASCRFIRRIP
jgi:hypothetical protein